MKKTLIFIVLAVTVVFSACNKDGDGSLPSLINPYASMSASISGYSWSATTRVSVHFNNKFIVTGTSIDGKVVEVSIFGDSPGTYELNPLQSLTQMQGLWKPDGTTSGQNYVSVRGTATLTEVDTTNKMISGTFEFVAARTINDTVYVQNGAFSKLNYSEQ
jgi:Family of unknown function (DUF6252)